MYIHNLVRTSHSHIHNYYECMFMYVYLVYYCQGLLRLMDRTSIEGIKDLLRLHLKSFIHTEFFTLQNQFPKSTKLQMKIVANESKTLLELIATI